MLDTSTRLLSLLSLLQARRDWSGPELAERLEVGVRTIRRDVERLRTLGYPVHARSGVAGGYRLGAGAQLPPLLLDDEEAVALAVGLRTAAGGTVTGIEETSMRVLAKLEQVLPSRLWRRVNALGSHTVPLTGSWPTADPGTLALIAAACRDHEGLWFGYRSERGTSSRRSVEPHGLVHTGRRWYLVAWTPDRGDWRTYRVDRIEPGISLGRRFQPRDPPDGDVQAYVSRSVSTSAYPHHARVLLHAPLALVAERVAPTVATLEAIDEQTCLMRTGGNWYGEIAIYIAAIGVDFEILAPPELAQHIRELAQLFDRATR
jgi:predicted DNA-binding transcriptional regulator YafY